MDSQRIFVTGTGQKIINVHPMTDDCMLHGCCVHNPSEHHMREWPTEFRDSGLIERICEHGVGHPDPDSTAYFERTYPGSGYGVHGCDGCCASSEHIKAQKPSKQ